MMPKGITTKTKTKMAQTKRAVRGGERALAASITKRDYAPLRTGRRQGVGMNKEQPFPDPPDTWTGTLPEWAIKWALDTMGLRQDQDYQYLYMIDTALIVDFYVFDQNLALEIQGLFWHYQLGGGYKVYTDIQRKVFLETLGYTLVFIDEDDALANPIYYVREAMAGRDHSRVSKGF